MAYIGNSAANQTFTPVIDTFNGNGSTTAFTLTYPVASVAQVEAYISNVPQQPGVAYTVLGNTITFTSAPPSGTANIYVRYTSPITQIMQPGQGTVGTTQLMDAAVTASKVADASLTPAKLTVGAISWDSSGRVTMPYQPAFKARMSTNGNTSVANGSVMPFDTAMYNIGSNFNTSTYRFTAPVAGVYAFSYHSYKNGSSTPSLIAARVNTNALFRTRVDGSTDTVIVAAFSCYLSANDYVDVVNDSGVTFVAFDNTTGSYTSFEGYLVG